MIGLTLPREVFVGPFGYLQLLESEWDLGSPLAELGRRWRIAEFSHKPYPAGRATHGGIEGVIALRDRVAFEPGEIADVRISAPPLIVRLVGRPDLAVPEPSYARLCMAYVVAKVLLHGALDPMHFRDTALTDPATHALAGRVRTESDGNPDPNALAPRTVTMHLSDGRRLTRQCATMLANPTRPLGRTRHLDKFRRCWHAAVDRPPPGDRERLIDMVGRLETHLDLRVLTPLLAE